MPAGPGRGRHLARASLAVEAPRVVPRDLGSCRIATGGLAPDPVLARQCVEELRQRLRRVPDLPPWRGRQAAEDERLLWWFLRDRRLDVAESAAKLERCLRWRCDFRVDRLGPELFLKELRARKAYLHEHADVAGRPAIVAIAQRHNVLERRLLDSCRMCAWFMERALDQLETVEPPTAEPGGEARSATEGPESREPVEQALGIFDLRDFSPLQADLEFAKFLVELLYCYYPGRLGRILLVDAPEVFSGFWDSVRPLLRHYASLTEFVTRDEVRRHYFAPGHMPRELEGW